MTPGVRRLLAGPLTAATAVMVPGEMLAQVTSAPSSAAVRPMPARDQCAAPPVGQGAASEVCRQACTRDPTASPACGAVLKGMPSAGVARAQPASPILPSPSWGVPAGPAAAAPSVTSGPSITANTPGSASYAPMPAAIAPAASSALPASPPAGPQHAQVPSSAPHNALPVQQSAGLRGNAASNLDWCKVNDCQPRVFSIDVAQLTTTKPVTLSGEGFGNRKGAVILSSDRGDRALDIIGWNDTRVVASAASVSGVLDGTVALKVKATNDKESVAVAVPFVAAREQRQVPVLYLHHCDKTTWDNVCQPNKASAIVDAWHMDWCGSNRDPLGSLAV
jgi:hypothetical protein